MGPRISKAKHPIFRKVPYTQPQDEVKHLMTGVSSLNPTNGRERELPPLSHLQTVPLWGSLYTTPYIICDYRLKKKTNFHLGNCVTAVPGTPSLRGKNISESFPLLFL